MTRETMFKAGRFILCGALLVANPTSSQMPTPLGRLRMTSTPAKMSIQINGKARPEITPVTLAVMQGSYKVTIGSCPQQIVTVDPGQTMVVDCTPPSH